jgi:hypothetical protein
MGTSLIFLQLDIIEARWSKVLGYWKMFRDYRWTFKATVLSDIVSFNNEIFEQDHIIGLNFIGRWIIFSCIKKI